MFRQIKNCLSVIASPLLAQGDKPAASTSSLPSSLAATVCDIAAHPAKYKNKRIRAQGQVLHTGIHGGSVIDPTCGGHGLHIRVAKSAEDHPDLVAFHDAIWNQGCYVGSDVFGKEIRGTFSGRFIWKPHEKVGKYSIEIDRVENLDVKIEPGICDKGQ
jgi:hypothetical protein